MKRTWTTYYLADVLPSTRTELAEKIGMQRAKPVDVVNAEYESQGWAYHDGGAPCDEEPDRLRVFVGGLIVLAARFEWVTVPGRLVREEKDRRVAELVAKGLEVSPDEKNAIDADVRTILRKRALPECEAVGVIIDETRRRVYLQQCPKSRVDAVVGMLEDLGCRLHTHNAESALALVTPRFMAPESRRVSELCGDPERFGIGFLEWLYWRVASSYASGIPGGEEVIQLSEEAQEFAPEGCASIAVGFVAGVALEHRFDKSKASIREKDPAVSMGVRIARKLGSELVQARLQVRWQPLGENVDSRSFEFAFRAKDLAVSSCTLDELAVEGDDTRGSGEWYLADKVSLMAEVDALVLALLRTYATLRESIGEWDTTRDKIELWTGLGGPWREEEEDPTAELGPALPNYSGALTAARRRLLEAAGPGGKVTVTFGEATP